MSIMLDMFLSRERLSVPSKDKVNWISFSICIIGTFLTILGILLGIIPLILYYIQQTFFFGFYFPLLSLIYTLILQGIIPFVILKHIKNKETGKHRISTKIPIVIISLSSLILINIYFGDQFFFNGTLLVIASFLTIFGGLLFKDYINFDPRIRLFGLLGIAGLIIIALFILPLYFTFAAFFISILISIFSSILLLLLPSFLISFFIINWDDRSQIIEDKYILYIYSCIPSLIFMFIPFPFDIVSNYGVILLILIVITIIPTLVAKYLRFKIIKFEHLSQIDMLEKGKRLIDVEDLKVYYPLLGGTLKRQVGVVKAVDEISFNIKTGETLGLVGESGCGKSTVAKAILNLVEKEQGNIYFRSKKIPSEFNSYLRQKIQMVFQDPDASLNPRMKIVDIIADPLKNLMGMTKKAEIRRHVLRLMEEVSLSVEHLDRYPHEFSGGQKQRIIIARALASNPELIILDEPTSALDVSVQAQILNLLKDLQKKYNYGYLFITHNLSVVNHIADRVAVMYLGRIVEVGDVNQIFTNPSHPYTQALLASRSEIDPYSEEIKFVIKGEVPSPINPPSGCHFNPRCTAETRTKECEYESPHQIEIEKGHYIWCVNPPLARIK